MFWRPRFLRPSLWVEHIPFAFWLVDTCRPNSFVELGVGSGVSYFAFCQAVDKLNLPTRCTGIEAADSEVFGGTEATERQTANWYNETQYQEFSRLQKRDAEGAEAEFSRNAVDILHVKVQISKEIAEALSHDWPSRLSKRSVLLIHAPERQASVCEEAAALLEKLRGRYPFVELTQGNGLIAFLVGSKQPDKLKRLAALGKDNGEREQINHILQRLGDGYRLHVDARAESQRTVGLRRDLESTRDALEAANQELKSARDEKEVLQASLEARTRKAAEAAARLLDQETAFEEAKTRRDDLEAKIRSLETDGAVAAHDLAAKTEESTRLGAALEAARAEQADQQSRIAGLETEKDALAGDVSRLEAALALKEREISALSAELNQTRAASVRAAEASAARLRAAEESALKRNADEDARFELLKEEAEALISKELDAVEAEHAIEIETLRQDHALELGAATRAADGAEARAERIDHERQLLADALAAEQAELAELKAQHDTQTRALGAARDHTFRLEARVDQARQEIRTAEAATRDREREIDALKDSLAERFREIARLVEALDQERALRAEAEAKWRDTAEALERAERRMAAIESTLALARAEADRARYSLEPRIALLQSQIQARDADIQTRFSELAAMTKAMETGRSDRAALAATLAETRDALDQALAERTRLAESEAAAKAQTEAAEAKLSRLEATKAAQVTTIETQFETLSRTETNLAAANAHIDRLETHLDAISESRTWRFARWVLGRRREAEAFRRPDLKV